MAKEKNVGFHFSVYPEDPRAKAYHEESNAEAAAMSDEKVLSILNRAYSDHGLPTINRREFKRRFNR
jgi:hypothetical protein